jgi:hypothetical protein
MERKNLPQKWEKLSRILKSSICNDMPLIELNIFDYLFKQK